MDYNWAQFEKLFFPNVRSSTPELSRSLAPVHLIHDQENVCAAYDGVDDLSEWIGSPLEDCLEVLKPRTVFTYELGSVEAVLMNLHEVPHLQLQSQLIRDLILPDRVQKHTKTFYGKKAVTLYRENLQPNASGHFLLDGIRSWWRRLLPTSYGIYLKLEGHEDQEIALVIRSGQIQNFTVPDFSALSKEMRRQPSARLDHLNQTYLIPFYGLFIKEMDWKRWSQLKNPWRSVFRSLVRKQWKLLPWSPWGRFFLFLRAYFKI